MLKIDLKKLIFFLALLTPVNAFAVDFDGKFIQGHFIIGKVEPKSEIWIDKKKIKVTSDGYFAFGIGRDRKYDVIITKKLDGKKQKIVKKVQKRKYKIQRIDGLPEKKVTPPKEVYERIKRENKIIADARAVESDLTFFKNKFIPPLKNAIVTGVYGSQRILNGKPKWPHYGIDFAAKEGTKIKAMLDGTATMVEPDLFYTGGMYLEGDAIGYWFRDYAILAYEGNADRLNERFDLSHLKTRGELVNVLHFGVNKNVVDVVNKNKEFSNKS